MPGSNVYLIDQVSGVSLRLQLVPETRRATDDSLPPALLLTELFYRKGENSSL